MSQYFKADSRTLWNPSNRVAGLFVRSGESMAALVGLPTGVGGMWADEYEVDLEVFVPFVDALVREYRSSRHQILRALVEGYVVSAVVMVQRAGRELPSLSSEVSTSPWDVQVSASGVSPRADDERLADLVRERARAMPV